MVFIKVFLVSNVVMFMHARFSVSTESNASIFPYVCTAFVETDDLACMSINMGMLCDL